MPVLFYTPVQPQRRQHLRPFFVLLIATCSFAQVVITELQRDPQGGETSSPGGASHEFIEITNLGTDTFRIDSLFISDGGEADQVIAFAAPLPHHEDCITGSTMLAPGQTGLLLDKDYAAAIAAVVSSRLPIRPGTVLFTTGDADLGNGLAADDGILLYKGTKTAVREAIWCAADAAWSGTDPVAGKIVLSRPKNVAEGFSVVPVSFLLDNVCYGTCADSLTPGSFELLQNNWFVEWRFLEPDSAARTFACSLACIRSGSLPAAAVFWSVIAQSGVQSLVLKQGSVQISGNRGGARFTLPLDSVVYCLQIRENDTVSLWQLDVSQLWTPLSPIKVNEIFPRATAAEPEWIELFNSSSMSINLRNWRYGNAEGTDTITANDCFMKPGEFLVLTANASLFSQRYPAKMRTVVPPHWHSLDNYNDTLCLWDGRGSEKERVCYRSEWFVDWKYQSLERASLSAPGTSRSAWALAASSTPGQPSGAVSWRATDRPQLAVGPLPFTPNGDGRNDVLSIALMLPSDYSASITIYGFSGKKLKTFRGGAVQQLFWDGRQDNGSPAPLGPFFVVMEATSPKGPVTVRKKGVLWR